MKHPVARWFMLKALISTDDQCIYWPFSRSNEGYPRINRNGKPTPTSRWVCELVHGPAPSPEYEAAHSCGRGHLGCINPNHLRWDTRKGNFADKLIHGTDTRGQKSPVAKLTDAQVAAIRSIGEVVPQGLIAQEFGIAQSYVSRILSGSKRMYG